MAANKNNDIIIPSLVSGKIISNDITPPTNAERTDIIEHFSCNLEDSQQFLMPNSVAMRNYLFDWGDLSKPTRRGVYCVGPVGSSKSHLTCVKLALSPMFLAREQVHPVFGRCKLVRARYIKETLEKYREKVVKEVMNRAIPTAWIDEKMSRDNGMYRVYKYEYKGLLHVIEVACYGMAETTDKVLGKIQGDNIDVIVFNELQDPRIASKLNPLFTEVYGRIGRDGTCIPMFFGDFNCPQWDNHIWSLVPRPSEALHKKPRNRTEGFLAIYKEDAAHRLWVVHSHYNFETGRSIPKEEFASPVMYDPEWYQGIIDTADENAVRERVMNLPSEPAHAGRMYHRFRMGRNVTQYAYKPGRELWVGCDADMHGGAIFMQEASPGQFILFNPVKFFNDDGFDIAKKLMEIINEKYHDAKSIRFVLDPIGAKTRGTGSKISFKGAFEKTLKSMGEEIPCSIELAPKARDISKGAGEYAEWYRGLVNELFDPKHGSIPRLLIAEDANLAIKWVLNYHKAEQSNSEGSTTFGAPVKDDNSGGAEAVSFLAMWLWSNRFGKDYRNMRGGEASAINEKEKHHTYARMPQARRRDNVDEQSGSYIDSEGNRMLRIRRDENALAARKSAGWVLTDEQAAAVKNGRFTT